MTGEAAKPDADQRGFPGRQATIIFPMEVCLSINLWASANPEQGFTERTPVVPGNTDAPLIAQSWRNPPP